MATYADLLKKESIQSNMLAVIKPRRLLAGWTLVSGTTYYSSFVYGRPYSLFDDSDNEFKTESTSYPPASGKWYYNESEQRVYYNYTSTVTTIANNFITVT